LGRIGPFDENPRSVHAASSVLPPCAANCETAPARHLRDDPSKPRGRDGFLKASRTRLTSRESEVRQFVAEGSANKQVATELGISIKTVEKHRQHLMDKLNIHDTAGLTRHAIAAGVIESSVQLTIV
jgi:DNA-binding NarL/FixJ family response regulator